MSERTTFDLVKDVAAELGISEDLLKADARMAKFNQFAAGLTERSFLESVMMTKEQAMALIKRDLLKQPRSLLH